MTQAGRGDVIRLAAQAWQKLPARGPRRVRDGLVDRARLTEEAR